MLKTALELVLHIGLFVEDCNVAKRLRDIIDLIQSDDFFVELSYFAAVHDLLRGV